MTDIVHDHNFADPPDKIFNIRGACTHVLASPATSSSSSALADVVQEGGALQPVSINRSLCEGVGLLKEFGSPVVIVIIIPRIDILHAGFTDQGF